MNHRFRSTHALIAGVCLVAASAMTMLPAAVVAGEDNARIRAAVQAGEIAPLDSVLKVVNRDFPGQVIEVELDSESGVLVYKIKVLGPEGHVSKLQYDAKSLALLKAKGNRPARDGKP